MAKHSTTKITENQHVLIARLKSFCEPDFQKSIFKSGFASRPVSPYSSKSNNPLESQLSFDTTELFSHSSTCSSSDSFRLIIVAELFPVYSNWVRVVTFMQIKWIINLFKIVSEIDLHLCLHLIIIDSFTQENPGTASNE